MNKKDLSETDIRTKFITPAIVNSGWDLHTQIREEVALTAGKVIVRGKAHKRGPAKFADYILFLVDRNILADQAKTNDFKPFGSALTKIQKRQADKSYEIYLALYQAVSGTEDAKNIYKSTAIACARASRTASSPPTRSCASISTRTCSAGGHPRARPTSTAS